MAQCYHYEALRKQRVIDRAFEARCRLEKETQRKKVNYHTKVGMINDMGLHPILCM
jgi:hypothetical protein